MFFMRKLSFISLSFILLLLACGDDNPLKVDTSNITLELKVNRFEKEFFEADKYKLKELNQRWIQQYGILYESFVYDMLNEGSVHEPMIVYRLERFLNDSGMQNLYHEIDSTFSDFSSYKTDLTEAFKYYKYHFKDSIVPEVTTFYSNFNAKVFPTKTNLGIGLDLFLGEESNIVKRLPQEVFPQYFKAKMNPKYLASSAIKYWVYYKFSNPNEFRNYSIYILKDDFLNTMIHHGKMLYVTEALMPNAEPRLIFDFTPEQYKWCQENEYFIYQKLVEENLIYTKNQKDIARYINDGPFTSGLTEESPSMVGVYMGYSIVKQFMARNPKITLEQLLNEEPNSRRILSGYKP